MDCRGRVRSLFVDDPGTPIGAAQRVVDFFYNEFVDENGAPAYARVRFFKTEPFRNLTPDQRAFALQAAGVREL